MNNNDNIRKFNYKEYIVSEHEGDIDGWSFMLNNENYMVNEYPEYSFFTIYGESLDIPIDLYDDVLDDDCCGEDYDFD